MASRSGSTLVTKPAVLVIGLLGLGVLVAIYCIIVGCARYPSKADIDRVIDGLGRADSGRAKTATLDKLLAGLADPRSREDDEVLGYAVRRLINAYRTNGNEAILEAMDAVRLDGGFANTICGFYSALIDDNRLVARYKNPVKRPSVERCVGLSLSQEAVDRALGRHTAPLGPSSPRR